MKGNRQCFFSDKRILRMILLLVFFTVFQAFPQSDIQNLRMKKVIRNHSPFQGSTKKLDNLFNSFFTATQLGLSTEMDSLFEIMISHENELLTASDSGIFYFNQGFYWLRHSDYEKAQEFYSKSGILFEKEHLNLPNLYVKVHMAQIQYFMKKVKYAHDVFLEALYDPFSDSILKGAMHHNIGALLMEIDSLNFDIDKTKKQKSIDSITFHLDKAIEIFRALKYSRGYSATYSVYTSIKFFQKDYKGAKEMIDSCQQISLRTGDTGRMAFLNIKKATLLIEMKRYDAAIDTAYLAVNYYKQDGNFDQQEHALSAVYQAYFQRGDFENAVNVLNEISDVTAQRTEKQLADALAKYQVELETGKKDLTIKEQESLLESERLKTSNNNRLVIALVLLLLATLLGFLLFVQRRKRKVEQEKSDLIIKNKAEGLKAVIEAEEKERKRIAADLHDGIVQQLGGLKLGLQKVFDNNESEESQKIMTVLNDSTAELRDLSHQMMPRALGQLGLIPALEDLFDKSLGLTKIKYHFEHFGLSERFPENIEVAIFRISQELINNVIRHSNAQNVNIQLFKSVDHIIFIVEDNGSGFRNTDNLKGIGLMNISSRLDTINGQVNYEPSPESGTLVTIKIPLQ